MRRFVTLGTLLVLLVPCRTGLAQGATPGGQAAAGAQAPAENAPFPPLDEAAQARLDQLLRKWEAESKGTKRLECEFTRWHFDPLQAPAGVHASWAQGVIKYAAPDKGLFRVDSLKFFQGVKEEQRVYEAVPGRYGEHWICNGAELIEFDRSNKQCRIQTLPEELRGTQIFESPLPFVFNLDAQKIRERYWIREERPPANKPDVFVIQAWPKRQEDRSQYRFVTVVIDRKTFLPEAIVMYAPNYDPVHAPVRDQYEFKNVKRNAVSQMVADFLDSFINQRPPSDWTTIREKFDPAPQPPMQVAQPPGGEENPTRR